MKIKTCNMFLEVADAVCITTNGHLKKDGKAAMSKGTALYASKAWYGIASILGAKIDAKGNNVFVLTHQLPNGFNYFKLPRKAEPLLVAVPWAVVSFPTKKDWSDPSDPALIRSSCEQLWDLVEKKGWRRVLLPKPGCGNGGLSWKKVARPLLREIFGNDDRFIIVSNTTEE